MGLAFQRDLSVKFCRPLPRVLRLRNAEEAELLPSGSLCYTTSRDRHCFKHLTLLFDKARISSLIVCCVLFLCLTRKTGAQSFSLQKRSQSHIPPTPPLRPVALPSHLILRVKETSPANIGKMEGMDLATGKRKRSISNSLSHQQRPHPQTSASKSKSIHHSHLISFTLFS